MLNYVPKSVKIVEVKISFQSGKPKKYIYKFKKNPKDSPREHKKDDTYQVSMKSKC